MRIDVLLSFFAAMLFLIDEESEGWYGFVRYTLICIGSVLNCSFHPALSQVRVVIRKGQVRVITLLPSAR